MDHEGAFRSFVCHAVHGERGKGPLADLLIGDVPTSANTRFVGDGKERKQAARSLSVLADCRTVLIAKFLNQLLPKSRDVSRREKTITIPGSGRLSDFVKKRTVFVECATIGRRKCVAAGMLDDRAYDCKQIRWPGGTGQLYVFRTGAIGHITGIGIRTARCEMAYIVADIQVAAYSSGLEGQSNTPTV